jgi:hypothetical protein
LRQVLRRLGPALVVQITEEAGRSGVELPRPPEAVANVPYDTTLSDLLYALFRSGRLSVSLADELYAYCTSRLWPDASVTPRFCRPMLLSEDGGEEERRAPDGTLYLSYARFNDTPTMPALAVVGSVDRDMLCAMTSYYLNPITLNIDTAVYTYRGVMPFIRLVRDHGRVTIAVGRYTDALREDFMQTAASAVEQLLRNMLGGAGGGDRIVDSDVDTYFGDTTQVPMSGCSVSGRTIVCR